MYMKKHNFERYERYNLMKYINYFIILVFSIEIFSLVIGSGTHYEHHKFGLMVILILVNLSFNIFKKNINVGRVIKKDRQP